MGLVRLLPSRLLTAYQLAHIDTAWEPFFAGSLSDPRNGTEEIITSDMSKAWPIPDGGLGTISYVLEILMAVMGTRDCWRPMPWMLTRVEESRVGNVCVSKCRFRWSQYH